MTHSAFLREMDKEGMVQPLGSGVEIPRVVLDAKAESYSLFRTAAANSALRL